MKPNGYRLYGRESDDHTARCVAASMRSFRKMSQGVLGNGEVNRFTRGAAGKPIVRSISKGRGAFAFSHYLETRSQPIYA